MKRSVNRDLSLEPTLGEVQTDAQEFDVNLRKPVRIRKPRKVEAEPPLVKPEIEIKKPAIVLASLLLLVSAVMFAFDQLFSPDSFQVEELRISTDFEQLQPQQIRERVLPLIQNNYFAVDLKKVEQVVENIPWVDQVSVRRQWPRSIHIRLSEQKAIAQWGEDAYLNSRAEPFLVSQKIIGDLPYLYGPKGTEQELLERFHDWKKRFAQKKLILERLTMSPRYSYQARVFIPREQQKQLTEQALMELFEKKEQPVPVLDWHQIAPFALTLNLGKEAVEQRVDRFIAAFPQAFNEELLKVESVDLRYPNGFAVRFSEKELPQDFMQLAVKIDENMSK